MPRTEDSAADRDLITDAAGVGVAVRGSQLERWRGQGLLMPNVRRGLGRGRGSASQPAPGARELVVWLARHARRGRRPYDLALRAFGEGLAVPEVTVRAALRDAVDRVRLSVETAGPAVSGVEKAAAVADAAVRAGLRATLAPARARRIDRRLRDRGIPWAPDELATFDAGPTAVEALRAADLTFVSVVGMLTGGSELPISQLGELARSMAPAGAVAPVSAMMERSWAHSPDAADRLLSPEGGLSFLPGGDQRDHLRMLVDTLPLADLLAGWCAAAQLGRWASDLCDAAEHEIDADHLGVATQEWLCGAFLGLGRMLLTVGLRDRRGRPVDLAFTALLLLSMRGSIRTLHQLLPDGQFDLLDTPLLMPRFVHALWNVPTDEGRPAGGTAI